MQPMNWPHQRESPLRVGFRNGSTINLSFSFGSSSFFADLFFIWKFSVAFSLMIFIKLCSSPSSLIEKPETPSSVLRVSSSLKKNFGFWVFGRRIERCVPVDSTICALLSNSWSHFENESNADCVVKEIDSMKPELVEDLNCVTGSARRILPPAMTTMLSASASASSV